jgi:uncharacterized membrane protein YidH (DUF202 family)
MTHTSRSALGARAGAIALAAAGILFALFPLLRPWDDLPQTSAGFTVAMGSPLWVAAHLCGALAFTLLCLGALAVRDALRGSGRERGSGVAVILLWVGTALTLQYFGAEEFALHALTTLPEPISPAAVDAIRMGGAQTTVFGVGLILVALGAILLAVAVWRAGARDSAVRGGSARRDGVLWRGSAVLLTIGISCYLPQFFLPPAGRIAHGIVMAAGALWLAAALWRSRLADRLTDHVE